MSRRFLAPLVVLTLVACGDDDAATPVLPENAAAAASTYAQIVQAGYADSVSSAAALQAAIDAFVAAPSEAGLVAAREAWLESREPYLQTEVYRFYEGPIDNAESGPEGMINAWPLDENWIDYVEGDATAGVINNPDVALTAEELRSLNERDGEKNIATGFHAIEFLLWGQDLSVDGPGNRPFTDYTEAANADRRATYLTLVTDLLVEDLTSVAAAWEDAAGTYRAEFLEADPEEAMRRMLTGMIILSGFETGGERLQTALDSGEQEDEHSCFSDNTHRDMIQDVRGVQNVWLGTYTRTDGTVVSGTGIRDVVAAADAELATALTSTIAESLRLAEAMQTPFDQEIAPGNTAGRERVAALVTSLRLQEDQLQQVFQLFELTIPPNP